MGAHVLHVFHAISVAVREAPLDRLALIDLAHEVVPGGGVGELVDQLVGDLFQIGARHRSYLFVLSERYS